MWAALASPIIRSIPWVPDMFSCACVHSSWISRRPCLDISTHWPKSRALEHCSWMHASIAIKQQHRQVIAEQTHPSKTPCRYDVMESALANMQ